ncbi:hypothetical protein ACNOYE_14825 [Nannocystaceae bacterium ST9]
MSALMLSLALLAGEPHPSESGGEDGRLHLQLDGDLLYGIGGQSFLGGQLHLRGGYAVWDAGRATGTLDLGVQLQYGNEPTWLAPWLKGVDVSGSTHRVQLVLTAGHTFHMGERRRVELGMRVYAGLNHWLSSYSLVYPDEGVRGSAKLARSSFVVGGQLELGYRFSRRVGANLVMGAPFPTPNSSSYVQGLLFVGLGLTIHLR